MNRRYEVKARLGAESTTFFCPLKGHIGAKIRGKGRFYEHGLLCAVRDLAVSGTYVDVGAHIGNHTVAFADFCPSKAVIAVEPNKHNLKFLTENASTREKVTVIEAECGSKTTETTRRLDELIADVSDVALVKIDVGGNGEQVLRGASRLIRRHKPVFVVEAATPELFAAVNKILSAFGYAQIGKYNWTPTYIFVPVKIYVAVVTCNRPQLLANLFDDLKSAYRPCVERISVYDDASTSNLKAAKQGAAKLECQTCWHRFDKRHGKKGFWEIVTKAFRDHIGFPERDLIVFLPDDIRLAKNFFIRALMAWNEIDDPGKATLTLQAERYRDSRPCWTGFAPERVTPSVWKTQWADGLFLCPISVLSTVGGKIPKPPESRWRNPEISSGVWQWFSNHLHKKSRSMYRVHRSLTVHVMCKSQMHGEHRRKTPIVAAKFANGDVRASKLLAADRIEASLASIPSRINSLKLVVESLVPQVDVVRVYLNGYEKMPGFLKGESKVVIARSQKHGDRGDAGKFFWCEQAQGYQLTCDDDLVYPPGYAARLIEGIERYGRRAVVSLHGVRLSRPSAEVESYYRDRTLSHWRSGTSHDEYMHLLGTGVMAYHASTVRLRCADFEQPNMADIWMAIVCQKQAIPMVSIARPSRSVHHLPSPWTIYDRERSKDGRQTKAVKRIVNWKTHKVD